MAHATSRTRTPEHARWELEHNAAGQAEELFGPRGRDLVAIVALVREDLEELKRIGSRGYIWDGTCKVAVRRAQAWLNGVLEAAGAKVDVDDAVAEGKDVRHQLRLVIRTAS